MTDQVRFILVQSRAGDKVVDGEREYIRAGLGVGSEIPAVIRFDGDYFAEMAVADVKWHAPRILRLRKRYNAPDPDGTHLPDLRFEIWEEAARYTPEPDRKAMDARLDARIDALFSELQSLREALPFAVLEATTSNKLYDGDQADRQPGPRCETKPATRRRRQKAGN